MITGQAINCVIFFILPRTAHSQKGDLSGSQLHSLRKKIVHLTQSGSNWFQLLEDGQSRLCLFGHVWVQELIEFWYQSLSLFCTWFSMQSILMSACVVYLPNSDRAKHSYCKALLPSVAHTCHCSVALISRSQSSLLLLPAITDWLDCVTLSQIQSLSPVQKQIHSETTLNLVVLSLCLEWRPYGSIWQCLSEAPYVIGASRLKYSF